MSDDPIDCIGRGGSGTRLLTDLALDIRLLLGNPDQRVHGISVDTVQAVTAWHCWRPCGCYIWEQETMNAMLIEETDDNFAGELCTCVGSLSLQKAKSL